MNGWVLAGDLGRVRRERDLDELGPFGQYGVKGRGAYSLHVYFLFILSEWILRHNERHVDREYESVLLQGVGRFAKSILLFLGWFKSCRTCNAKYSPLTSSLLTSTKERYEYISCHLTFKK